MATEQTITISGTPTVVSGVTVPYANTSDLEIYIGKGKVESIEVTNAGAGYTNYKRADGASKTLVFSGGSGGTSTTPTAPSPAVYTTVGENNSGRDSGTFDGKWYVSAANDADEVTFPVGSNYTTAPNISVENFDGGTGAQLTAKIYAKKTPITHYTLSGTSGNTTITFEAGLLADGDKVLIKRVTGVSTAANTFAAGSAITAEALNKSFDQIRYKVEELPNVTSTAVTNGVKDDISVSGGNWTIVNDAVTGAKIADDVINSEHYVADSIDTEHYAPLSVDAAALAANAVTTDKILNDNVTMAKLGSGTLPSDIVVNEDNLSANSVGSSELANNTVSAPKIDLSIVQGDLIYGTGTDTWNRLAKGAAGTQLRIKNDATAPEWAASNVQSNVYVKGYGIESTGITTPAAAGTLSNNLSVNTYYNTPITVTIIPQISSSFILLNATVCFEANVNDRNIVWRIKAEVLNSSNAVQSTSYITNNYTGSAVHNSGSTANGVASSGYVNKGSNLDKGIEGSNRIPMLIYSKLGSRLDNNDTTGSTAVISNLLHNPGTIVSSDATNNKVRYTMQVATDQASWLLINRTHDDTNTTTCERGVSWFTAQETMGSITVDTD